MTKCILDPFDGQIIWPCGLNVANWTTMLYSVIFFGGYLLFLVLHQQ